MIKSITVTNYLGDSLKLDLFKPEETGLAITSVTGLGPGKADINATEISTNDGSAFNSARLQSRNIVISLRFLWSNTIEEARQRTYKYFPIKKKVTLLIETDNRIVTIDGYVESNDPNIFSSEEGSDISIICPSPFFYSAYETQVTSFGHIEPAFEFPFSNESLTENLIELGTIRNETDRLIWYEGDCEVGITMTIRMTGAATGISIYNIGKNEVMTINTDTIASLLGSALKADDEIVICTVKGSKSAKIIRNGQTTNILNAIDKNSDWFQITKGDNIFAYAAKSGVENLQFEIQNRIVYEGV